MCYTTKANTDRNTAPPPAQVENKFDCTKVLYVFLQCMPRFGVRQVGGNLCVQLVAIFNQQLPASIKLDGSLHTQPTLALLLRSI